MASNNTYPQITEIEPTQNTPTPNSYQNDFINRKTPQLRRINASTIWDYFSKQKNGSTKCEVDHCVRLTPQVQLTKHWQVID